MEQHPQPLINLYPANFVRVYKVLSLGIKRCVISRSRRQVHGGSRVTNQRREVLEVLVGARCWLEPGTKGGQL